MKLTLRKMATTGVAMCFIASMNVSWSQEETQLTLIKNVSIFDGESSKLISGKNVLIEGNMIKAVGADIDAGNATVIDGGGRTLTPGLHDMHTHIALFREVTHSRNNLDLLYTGALAAARLEGMLMNGFTTIMDVGGPAKFAQKCAASATTVPNDLIH